MNCKKSFSQSKPCPFWGGDRCCDEEEYVDVETGELQCRYNSSSVHINEYREISGKGEAELPASDNTDYTKCSEVIMRNISGRRGYDLYSCDKDIVEDIRSSIANIIAEHFA